MTQEFGRGVGAFVSEDLGEADTRRIIGWQRERTQSLVQVSHKIRRRVTRWPGDQKRPDEALQVEVEQLAKALALVAHRRRWSIEVAKRAQAGSAADALLYREADADYVCDLPQGEPLPPQLHDPFLWYAGRSAGCYVASSFGPMKARQMARGEPTLVFRAYERFTAV